MSEHTFQLQVFTQQRKALDVQAVSITVPATDGQLGVLANHAPMMALLGDGAMKVRDSGGERFFQLSGGFMEVHANKATVLTSTLTEDGAEEDAE